MAASIGRPLIDPDTSTSGTSLPRSTCFGSAAFSDATEARPPSPAAAAASATAASRAAAAAASASTTPPLSAAHWPSIRSDSSVERPRRPAMHLAASSCGPSSFPLTPPLAVSCARRFWRAATRPASSGSRLPVASSAADSVPLSASLRNALRWRCRQSEATPEN